MRFTLVFTLDPEVMTLLRRGVSLLEQNREELRKMAAKERALAQQLAADAVQNRDAFTALKSTMEKQGAALKEALDKIAAGTDIDDEEVIAQLTSVHESLTGTNAEMVAAGVLANTPASSTVPTPAAEAAAAAASSGEGGGS